MNVTLSYIGCEVNVTLTEDEIYVTRVGEYVTRYTVIVSAHSPACVCKYILLY